MAVSIRTSEHHDTLRARQHRRATLKRAGKVFALLIVLGIPVWLVFGSSLFSIQQVTVSGAQAVSAAQIQEALEGILATDNIIFAKSVELARQLAGQFPALATVEIEKDYRHALMVSVTERVPIGIWCRGEACQYIDITGARWGSAARSRGALLLLADDERVSAASDDRLAGAIKVIAEQLPDLGLRAQWLTIPEGTPGQITAHVDANYDVYVDAFGDMVDQLATLKVFLADRTKDPGFKPQYVDLRTPGRVYFQ